MPYLSKISEYAMSEKTVTVELKNTWFAPTTVWKKSRLQQMSGRRFKKGIYTWPETVLKHLPKSAIVIEDEAPVEDPLELEGFGGFVGDDENEAFTADLGRAAVAAEQAIEEEALKNDKITAKNPDQILKERRDNLAKANAANVARRNAVKAEEEAGKAEAKAASEGSEDEVEF